MKLATYQDGSRDGQLVIVSRDLASAHYATGIATRLQAVLEDWNFLSPQLQDLSDDLNAGRARHAFPFDPARCLAPLPRAYEVIACTAYPALDELARQAGAAEAAPSSKAARAETAVATGHATAATAAAGNVQGTTAEPAADGAPVRLGGAGLLGAHAPIEAAREALGIDFGAGLAVITGDVPAGSSAADALDAIRLLTLANEVTLRSLVGGEQARGAAGFDSRPAVAFGPVAVTPDELAGAWDRGVLQGVLQSSWNGRKVGMCDTGADMQFGFGELVARACRTHALQAGTIVASGPVGNRGVAKGARMDWPRGSSSIAGKRWIETVQDGSAKSGFMRFGDTIRIEMKGKDGRSLFGAIEQEVVEAGVPREAPAEGRSRRLGGAADTPEK